jgi:hypothetical protein
VHGESVGEPVPLDLQVRRRDRQFILNLDRVRANAT